jgi:hypothetical protein
VLFVVLNHLSSTQTLACRKALFSHFPKIAETGFTLPPFPLLPVA